MKMKKDYFNILIMGEQGKPMEKNKIRKQRQTNEKQRKPAPMENTELVKKIKENQWKNKENQSKTEENEGKPKNDHGKIWKMQENGWKNQGKNKGT